MIQVILIRLLSSTLILKFPLLGAILAIIADYFDLNLLEFFNHGNLILYQRIDKTLDLFYLSLEAYIGLSWKNKLARNTVFILFVFRLIGEIIFELTQNEAFLVIFPNVFEYFYLSYLIHLLIFKKDLFSSVKRILLIVLLLTIPKLIHEYLLHINTIHPWSQNPYFGKLLFWE